MSNDPRGICVRIEMEFSNGETWRAVGSDADKIKRHFDNAEVMNHIHGMKYNGPTLHKVETLDVP